MALRLLVCQRAGKTVYIQLPQFIIQYIQTIVHIEGCILTVHGFCGIQLCVDICFGCLIHCGKAGGRLVYSIMEIGHQYRSILVKILGDRFAHEQGGGCLFVGRSYMLGIIRGKLQSLCPQFCTSGKRQEQTNQQKYRHGTMQNMTTHGFSLRNY